MQESTAGYHFGAFFVSGTQPPMGSQIVLITRVLAGLFSSLVSHVVNARFRFPRLVAELAKPAAPLVAPASAAVGTVAQTTRRAEILPSLGSSGAIYAAVTVTALAFPDAVVSLIFPPTNPIPIQWGVGGLVMLDLVGIMRGWR
jgi:rhomboid-like protein